MPKSRKGERRTVTVSVRNVLQLSKAGSALVFDIRDKGRRVGQIELGRGSVIWWGRNKQTGKRIPWTRFAELMEEAPGRPVHLSRK